MRTAALRCEEKQRHSRPRLYLPPRHSEGPLRLIRDRFGYDVGLTEERLAHILRHAEMASLEGEIERVLQAPEEVRVSRSDDDVKLFYRYFARTLVGGKWLCVVVKYLPNDAFAITAYLTDKLKAGESLWPTR